MLELMPLFTIQSINVFNFIHEYGTTTCRNICTMYTMKYMMSSAKPNADLKVRFHPKLKNSKKN